MRCHAAYLRPANTCGYTCGYYKSYWRQSCLTARATWRLLRPGSSRRTLHAPLLHALLQMMSGWWACCEVLYLHASMDCPPLVGDPWEYTAHAGCPVSAAFLIGGSYCTVIQLCTFLEAPATAARKACTGSAHTSPTYAPAHSAPACAARGLHPSSAPVLRSSINICYIIYLGLPIYMQSWSSLGAAPRAGLFIEVK